jgi:gliding motility-associated-like protein
MHRLWPLFTLIMLCCFSSAFAQSYTVTSNADTGPGTLRDALTKAVLAGDAPTKTITFNFSDNSTTGRTITLKSALPALPSNLTIDASSQSGAKFGLSDAEVELYFDVSIPTDAGFSIVGKQNIYIMGLYLNNGFTDHTDKLTNVLGVSIVNGSNIQIGAAGKGNVIFGFAYSIQAQGSNNLTIKDNFCDVDIDGASLAQNLAAYYGISITDSYSNITIGGATSAEGNLIAEPVEIAQTSVSLPATIINIQFNKLNTDYNITKTLGVTSYIDIAEPTAPSDNDIVNIEDNVISGYISEENITNTATFLRNYIDVDRTEKIILAYAYNLSGIIIKNSIGPVIIGSETNTADGNVIAYCKPFDLEHTNQVSFNRNSLFCNNNLAPIYQNSNYAQIPTVSVTDNEQTGLVGTATPNSTVDLYYSDLCHVCSPQTFFSSVQADAKGNWVYVGTLDVAVIASATLNGSTSEFSNSIVIDTTHMYMVHPTCQTGQGSITGIKAVHATSYYWTDANNTVISNTLDLPSEPAGVYTLTVQSEGCSSSRLFNLYQVPPTKFPDYPVVIQNSCPTFGTGYIQITTDSLVKEHGYQWVDSAGNTLASNQDILNFIPPGTYSLYLTDQGGCSTFYKNFTVDSLVTFKILTDSMKIIPAVCGHSTGSISGLRVTEGQPPYSYGWINSANNTISDKPNLANVPPGTYTFLVGDDSKCGSKTIQVTIPDSSIFIPTPLVTNVMVCSTGYTFIGVNNPDSSSMYNLYTGANTMQPMAQAMGGLFRVNIQQNTSYFITKVNGTCESDRAQLDVSISLSSIGVANTFTPNGDGINDYWKINNIETYPQATVQVFTRDGQRIFESKGYTVPFDGTYKGKKLPVGVYYYIIDLHTKCSLLAGSLTILR